MIEKMKFLSITGPKADIDRVVNTYLSRYEIHLENALSELTTVTHLAPFMEINPYKEVLSTVNNLCEELEYQEPDSKQLPDIEDALSFVRAIDTELKTLEKKNSELEGKQTSVEESLRILRPFRSIDYDLSSILHFQFVHYHFGRIEKIYFQKFEKYIYDNLDTIFVKCDEDEQYIWGIYFMPKTVTAKVNAAFSSMHFENVFVPDVYDGTAKESFENLCKEQDALSQSLAQNKKARAELLQKNAEKLYKTRACISGFSRNFDVRRLAACTGTGKDPSKAFYILCGWMGEKDALAFQDDIRNDSNVYCIIDGEDEDAPKPDEHLQPPTRLKNPKLFKPFEMYIKMYGLPAYNEMDPTWFVALTYSFIFGAMFGDVGQGLLLFIGGFLLYKFKNITLAGIISCAGVFSTFFGFMFGSIFGFEDILPALWLRPMNSMTTIPFIGKLNTVFIIAIGFGMCIILLCMVFNIINACRSGDKEKIWFDTNAAAGLVFYGSAVAVIALLLTGHTIPGGAILFLMFGVPLLLIFFKEPLTALVEKKAEVMPKQKGMFLVQGIFEMFEVLLSYFSNTLSFVRIGAFAVSHAAMMEVVLMLAGVENGNPNWIIIVLGNLFVCGMEGLIVGIQVLRLEYYEIFSRFYKGTGRKFEPFCSKKA